MRELVMGIVDFREQHLPELAERFRRLARAVTKHSVHYLRRHAVAFGFRKHEQGGTLERMDLRAMAGSHQWSNRKFVSMTVPPMSR